MSILQTILSAKREEVGRRRLLQTIGGFHAMESYAMPRRPFAAALQGEGMNIIAELKKASPSKGLLRDPFDVPELARAYERGGACALSVLTDEHFFQGNLEYVAEARASSTLPVLRKDFIIDVFQVHEARAAGADAVLLIVAALEEELLRDLMQCAQSCAVETLVEVHSQSEADIALKVGARVLGINNRDLGSFEVDLSLSAKVAAMVPKGVTLVAESGITTGSQMRILRSAGIHAFLIGEALVRSADPEQTLRQMLKDAEEPVE